jgi:hypothetical protein
MSDAEDDPAEVIAEFVGNEDPRPDLSGGAVHFGDNLSGGGVQIGGGTQHIVINGPAAAMGFPPAGRYDEDPRQQFLGKVRDLALTEASSAARFARIFMSLGAVIVLLGGALAVLRVGISHGTSTGWVTALGGALVGTVGGAFRLHANHERKNLDREAAKVVEELHADHSREEALIMIDRVDDPVLRDRLRSITAMRTLGLAPGPDEVANRVFPPSGPAKAEIESPTADE